MATIRLDPDFKEFLRLLTAHRVEYLLIGGASRRRRMTSSAKSRLETAVDKVELLASEMQTFEDERAEQLVDIDLRWTAKDEEIETVAMGLVTTDITVEKIAIVWVPTD